MPGFFFVPGSLCVRCPADTYQEKQGQTKCDKCPTKKQTFGKTGMTSESNCSNSEPHAPPNDVRGHSTSFTSIFVQWDTVPAADPNGAILSYTVTYKALPDGSPQTKVVSAPTTEVTLTGLKNNTNYSITVSASSVKGDGNISAPIYVMTTLTSKLSNIYSIYVLIHTKHFLSVFAGHCMLFTAGHFLSCLASVNAILSNLTSVNA